MVLERSLQSKFYQKEIESIIEEFKSYLHSGSNDLLNKNELFLGQFEFVDEKRGNVVFSFVKTNCPLLKIPYTVLSMANEYSLPENWNNITYQTLRSKARKSSEALPIFIYSNSENDNLNRLLIGFHNIDIDFIDFLNKGQKVVFAKKDPPIRYLSNLIFITDNLQQSSEAGLILDADYKQLAFTPTLENDSDLFFKFFNENLLNDNIVIIQGPPGTGKTTFISKICDVLLKKDYSVLSTTLANKSLLELADKPALLFHLEHHKIKKTNLNYNEKKQIPELLNVNDIKPEKGNLILTTYYKMTDLAIKNIENPIFDYIILEEASQTFLGTIAACRVLAKKIIIVGDPMQLPPVINQKNPELISNKISLLTNSFEVFASNCKGKKYRLTSTYRLMPEAAIQTGVFYENSLISKAKIDSSSKIFENIDSCFSKKGGTSIKFFNTVNDEIKIFEFISNIIDNLFKIDSNFKIAVLSPFKDSVKILQRYIYPKFENKTELIEINTVDGVQGMTTQFTFYYIPYRNETFSFNIKRFNVATSRAEICTLIITDEIYKEINPTKGLVATFWNKITEKN